MPLLPPPRPMSLATLPPAMDVTPFGSRLLIGGRGVSPCPAAMLLLALAAPVFADSTSFLKNPLFLAFGVVRPPSSGSELATLPPQSAPAAEVGLEP